MSSFADAFENVYAGVEYCRDNETLYIVPEAYAAGHDAGSVPPSKRGEWSMRAFRETVRNRPDLVIRCIIIIGRNWGVINERT